MRQTNLQPDEASRERSLALAALIRAGMEASPTRVIPFERFMELALYAPGLGYYQSESPKFGELGDFITAPEISPLFSRCLARQVEQILEILGRATGEGGDVLEVGAGSGTMAVEIMAELQRRHALPGRYLIVEKSPALRHLQRATIQARLPGLSGRFHWPEESLPPQGFRGVILANELLDAMPACRFSILDGGVRECHVGWNDGQFIRQWAPARPAVEEAVRHVEETLGRKLPDGYTSEVNLAQTAWAGAVAARLDAGLLLLVDYGYPRAEYYHPQRRDGTLACHYRHGLHDDPFFLPGLQDISAHVDFTAIAEAAAARAALAGFTTQRDFLFSTGLLELCADMDPRSPEYLRAAQAIKTLTLPGEMGDVVKVMGLTCGIEGELAGELVGFGGRDLRGRL